MPTPTGRPKVGERVYVKTRGHGGSYGTVLARSSGLAWSLKIQWDDKFPDGRDISTIHEAGHYMDMGWITIVNELTVKTETWIIIVSFTHIMESLDHIVFRMHGDDRKVNSRLQKLFRMKNYRGTVEEVLHIKKLRIDAIPCLEDVLSKVDGKTDIWANIPNIYAGKTLPPDAYIDWEEIKTLAF